MKEFKKGDIVRALWVNGDKICGIYLNEYVSINQTTGEKYVCAEVMWFKSLSKTSGIGPNEIGTCSFDVIEVVREAA
jgi:hypothetical protein